MSENPDYNNFDEIRAFFIDNSIPIAINGADVQCSKCIVSGKSIMLSDPFVGSNYGKPVKIAFIGIDTGEADFPCQFEKRRDLLQNSLEVINPHLKGTVETIQILRYGNIVKSYSKADHVDFVEFRKHFYNLILMNASKCCVKDNSMDAAPKHFPDNCKELLHKELAYFKPDLIVTQGNPPWDSLKALSLFDSDIKRDIIELLIENQLDDNKARYLKYPFDRFLQVATIDNTKKALVIGLPHPSARSRAWKDVKNCFLPYMFSLFKNKSKQMVDFAESRCKELNTEIFKTCFGIQPDSWT